MSVTIDKSCPFSVGATYTRTDIYDLLEIPRDKQRGNWETGYNRWMDDLYIFSTVGSAATGGYDYNNRWEGDIFVWYAKEGTTLKQPQIKWMLNPTGRVFIFTRSAVRNPFIFQGIGLPFSFEDSTPVLIRWKLIRQTASHENINEIERPFIGLNTEETAGLTYAEGAVRHVVVNSYERNPAARRKCLAYYGYSCCVCDFDFSSFYGDIGKEFIHVHHLKDLATIGCEYKIDPIADLRPVCPNCHAMLHIERPALTIERLRTVVQRQREQSK